MNTVGKHDTLDRMIKTQQDIRRYTKQLNILKTKIRATKNDNDVSVTFALHWLKEKRNAVKSSMKIVPISELSDWRYRSKEGIVRHNKGLDHFFSVQGVIVKNSAETEVSSWNQPILVQQHAGFLIMLCQEREGTVQFLLQGRFEAGNIHAIQFGPTIQATTSNLRLHHGGRKPLLSDYIADTKSRLIYAAEHNEEGSRFWRKRNVNQLRLLSKDCALPHYDNFLWLTLPVIKKLMLYDNVVNPFVKTILCPL